ncbi:MAG: STAS domain-containing protein [Taibaiella sp.]|nr:STAS domain-containing protein [Taibaiella sp.]
MEFKIDTKDNFTLIVPVSTHINAIMAEELGELCEKYTQNGSNNFIIDMLNATSADSSALPGLLGLHETCYANEQSLVFTGITPGFWAVLKENEADLLLNIAPKMIEAIDIVNMEILERDLLGEE